MIMVGMLLSESVHGRLWAPDWNMGRNDGMEQ